MPIPHPLEEVEAAITKLANPYAKKEVQFTKMTSKEEEVIIRPSNAFKKEEIETIDD